MIQFAQTRKTDSPLKSFEDVILNPSADFGGLYIPNEIPKLDENFVELYSNFLYEELCLKIFDIFNFNLDGDVLKKSLKSYINFDSKIDPVPLVKVKDNLFFNELFHGPSRSFKDIAMQPFSKMLSLLLEKRNQKRLIIVATSGDTGPAAIEGFKNQKNIKIVCLYPYGLTSHIQRLQMITQKSDNLLVLGVNGNFDILQTKLKKLLNSDIFKRRLLNKDLKVNTANSVNFGRIIFQIIYHISSYLKLAKKGILRPKEKVDVIIPSGNFGNAMGAYYAKEMGLPIRKIIIISNKNNALSLFFQTGIYDLRDKKLLKTITPAIDILKSSNLERLFTSKLGQNKTRNLMSDLENKKFFKLDSKDFKKIEQDFKAYCTNDKKIRENINRFATLEKYIMDPHTASCIDAYNSLSDNTKCIICATAEWTKFSLTITSSINSKKKISEQDSLKEISNRFNIKVPQQILSLLQKEIEHEKILNSDQIEEEILNFI